LRNRLKYALNAREVTMILHDKEANVRVDRKVRRDAGFPTGFMDVVSIEKTSQNFRVLYDSKGRFILKAIKPEEANIKLLRVKSRAMGPNKIPYIVTHDSRTIRFPHPDIDACDVLKYDLKEKKIIDFAKLEIGNTVYVNGGNNIGRVGIITHIERHPGSFDIVHVRDANNKVFATRKGNIFLLGKGKKSWIELPSDHGLYLTALEERKRKQSMWEKESIPIIEEINLKSILILCLVMIASEIII